MQQKAEFTSFGNELISMLFIPEKTIFQKDLVFLQISEKLKGTKVLPREESVKIKSGPQYDRIGQSGLERFDSEEGIVFYAEKSSEEAYLIIIKE